MSHALAPPPRRRAPLSRRLLIPSVRLLGAVSPALASRAAERLFFTPRRRRAPARERAVLGTAAREWVEFRGKRIAVWRWGHGPAVLLAHGWSGGGGQLTAFVEPFVSAGFSVLTWDAPGHGRSQGKRSDLLEFAALIDVLARREGRVRAIVGHSLGGAATVIACAGGAPAERVVLIGAAADPTDFFRWFLDIVGFDDVRRATTMARLERKFAFRWAEANVARAASSLEHIPALVVHDRDDADVPIADAEEIVRSWPGARLHATSGLGHCRVLREPSVVTTVGRFLTEGTGQEFHSEAENLESDLWDRRTRWQPTPAV
jgi:pimeloyl-ACP methyl ester carboxylesterase